MTEDSDLNQKRKNLKDQLSAGEYKTLIDVMLDRTGCFIQKLSRNSILPPFWYSALVLALLIWLISLLLSIFLDESHSIRREFITIEILVVALLVPIWIGFKIYTDSFFSNVHNHLLDAIESKADLVNFQHWLAAVGNLKKPLVLGLVVGVWQGITSTIMHTNRLGGFIGFGPMTFLVIALFVSGGIGLYYVFLFIALPVRLSRYHFKLYTSDPSSSETIDRLSDLLSNFVYLWAALIALAILLSALAGQWFEIRGLIQLWIPLILLFILNQYALSRIITNAKWKTLNDIQAKIEQLQTQEEIPAKDTLAHIRELMDYHDHIRNTRNSALDLRAGLNFLNSLLIPLLAFILANLDRFFS